MNKKSHLLLLLLGLSFSPAVFCKVYYVANNGDDGGPGTIGRPFLTVQRAQKEVKAGDTVYIRGGLYKMNAAQIARYSGIWAYVTLLDKSGQPGRRINYWAYPGERPVFDYSAIGPPGYRINAFQVDGSWIHLRGLEVVGVQVTITTHTQSECFENQGSDNIYEQLCMHDGMAIGFYLVKGGNNLVLNCDAYNNWDSVSQNHRGGNTDGFGCHPHPEGEGYTGNIFRGCRAWFNSDDGYDCINSSEAVTFDHCWAFYNGYSGLFASLGDGNGFKAGGYGIGPDPRVPSTVPRNVVRFCLAVHNKANGFYGNHHPGGDDWLNNSAYKNGVNYNMLGRSADHLSDVPGYGHNLLNNLGYAARGAEINNLDTVRSHRENNSFDLSTPLSAGDFRSLDESLLTAPRRPDGSLPVIDFMHPAPGSGLSGNNMGCFDVPDEGVHPR